MKKEKAFLDLIKEQRSKSKEDKFKGTFLEYLDLIQDNPSIVKLAHKRLYDAIVNNGISEIKDEDPRKRKIFDGDNIRIYDYFDKEFFGMETVIEKIMRFFIIIQND